tara:strand:- start:47 stop:451 length:405 start_codon:yes stop_codon:yes gene_type:complete
MFGQYNDLVWFMLGVFAYRTLTAMLSYGHLVNMMTEVNKQCLTLLGLVSADLSLAREVKYSHLHKSGLSETELEDIKTLDARAFETWKLVSVSNIITHFPRSYKFILKYQDWEGAMRELDRIYKKDIKRKRKQT